MPVAFFETEADLF